MDQIEVWGFRWLQDTYKYIQEDKAEAYKFAMMIAPLARTAQTKEGARAQQSYGDKLRRIVESLTPWSTSGLREQLLAQGVKPGTTVVLLDPGDGQGNPLWEGAATIRKGSKKVRNAKSS